MLSIFIIASQKNMEGYQSNNLKKLKLIMTNFEILIFFLRQNCSKRFVFNFSKSMVGLYKIH